MPQPNFSDVYDPARIESIISDSWLKDARLVASGVAAVDSKPITQGTMIYSIKERIVQDVSAQRVAAGGTIATSVPVQVAAKHPVIWGYGSITEADVNREIMEKGASEEDYAGISSDIAKWNTQALDDSIVRTIEGTAAALSANNASSGATITLALLITALSKRGERGTSFNGGGIAFNSAIYWKLVGLGVIAATSNTFGNAMQDQMVQNGQLPVQVLGMTPIISDKMLTTGANVYYVYLVQRGALRIRAAGAPEVKSAVPIREFSVVTDFKNKYGIGFAGMTYGGTASEVISDTDLATSANWTVSYTAENAVGLTRINLASA